jgi:hypothetical protein
MSCCRKEIPITNLLQVGNPKQNNSSRQIKTRKTNFSYCFSGIKKPKNKNKRKIKKAFQIGRLSLFKIK